MDEALDNSDDDYINEYVNNINFIYDQDYLFVEHLYKFSTRLRDYCIENALPIFNHKKTPSIIIEHFL